MRNLWVTVLSVMVAFPALANTKPAELTGVIQSDEPVGKGALNKLFFHVYDASLWSDSDTWSYATPSALSVTYRMNFSADEIIDRSIEEMQAIRALAPETEKTYRTWLNASIPDIAEGDRITALYNAKGKLSFYHNGTLTHAVNNTSFAKAFLDIWLSAKTSEPSLRKKLLSTP